MPTVTVACKLPHGLQLQLQTMVENNEPVMGGGTRKVKRAERTGRVVVIAGFAQQYGEPMTTPIQGGYALTFGVDADFFKAWLIQNADHPSVEAGLIYAHEDQGAVIEYAKENVKVLSGLEATDPANLPQEFRKRITPASEARS